MGCSVRSASRQWLARGDRAARPRRAGWCRAAPARGYSLRWRRRGARLRSSSRRLRARGDRAARPPRAGWCPAGAGPGR